MECNRTEPGSDLEAIEGLADVPLTLQFKHLPSQNWRSAAIQIESTVCYTNVLQLGENLFFSTEASHGDLLQVTYLDSEGKPKSVADPLWLRHTSKAVSNEHTVVLLGLTVVIHAGDDSDNNLGLWLMRVLKLPRIVVRHLWCY